jgi:protein involved in polysaccharide export with SLBB domain
MMNKLNTYPHLLHSGAVFLAFALLFAPILPVWADSSDTPQKNSKTKTTEGGQNNYPKMVIGSGDLLYIQVYGENGLLAGGGGSASGSPTDLLPTDYQVDSDGVIVFPFLGRVHLEGLTPVEASEKIARLLSKPRKVTVLIRQSNTFWVSVLGDVSRPGKYQILGKPTLLSALAEAGGPMPDSDMGGAILIHKRVKTKLSLDRYLRDTSVEAEDPYLYPGDTLMVPKSPWPSIGDWAIIASILASGAIIAVELSNIKH